jgi:hypothetical protein
MWSLYGVDAMFISLAHSIPTLNGYSAWEPAGWQLANPQEPTYLAAVDRWIEQNSLRNVCMLDIEKRTMTPYSPTRSTNDRARLAPGVPSLMAQLVLTRHELPD